tara:strand:- start:1732 stop:2616 length:885 start_codon:yes stop_codon:yes gene_type:complete
MKEEQLNPLPYEYYGDNVRWFIATVIDASPPFGFEGRVKIRVHGLHTEETYLLPQQDLPWAQCVLPTTEGGISGIGKSPKIQPNSLVFGMFMDGNHSQTPIILGSLPHIEFPTLTQNNQVLEDVGDDSKPESVFSKLASVFKPRDKGIENDNTSSNPRKLSSGVQTQRTRHAVQFLLNLGYTENQAIAITSGLFISSKLITGKNGIGNFSSLRFSDLIAFSPAYKQFTTQLEFVVFELRGTKQNANIKILQNDSLEGTNSLPEIVTKYYLENNTSGFKDEVEAKALEIKESIGE